MTLQNAWRERKVKVPMRAMRRTPQPRVSGTALEGVTEAPEDERGAAAADDSPPRCLKRKQEQGSSDNLVETADARENSTTAASTTRLQALTRGMLARRSFITIKKQAIASLVIQKSIVQWWDNQHHPNKGPEKKSRPNGSSNEDGRF